RKNRADAGAFFGRLRGNRVRIPSGPATVTGTQGGCGHCARGVGRPWSMTRRKPGNLPASEGTYTPSGQKVRMETLQERTRSLRRLSVPAPCVGGFFCGPPALRVRNI